MYKVALVHWKAAEQAERLAWLANAGLHARPLNVVEGAAALRALRDTPPDAVVIDLSRLPSHGRETALALRQTKSTRGIPIVFVDGQPEKVAAIKSILPDAIHARWANIGPAIDKAIKTARVAPHVPDLSRGYSGTPLPKKLGIADDSTLMILNGPRGFAASLDLGSRGVSLKTTARGSATVIMLFVGSIIELHSNLKKAVKCVEQPGALWIAWPKKSSGVVTDVGENDVRQAGLQAGLVDTKVCAIDATWSGLRFNRRAAKEIRRPKLSK
ncbi:MAG: DUF3052 family protein [Phycisphaerales bacterium]|nr:DUF3052 family protein [Phycisphaerales bacterium]